MTELITEGSLRQVLNSENQSCANHNWTPTRKFICLLGITDAMRYLHMHGIIHRDLKPQNILIDRNFTPRIYDFGFARVLSKSNEKTMSKGIGTPIYMAPELLEGRDNYTEAVDVFAFSMIAYELITGNLPYSELEPIESLALTLRIMNGYRPTFPQHVNEKMKNLISSCWSHNDNDRPSFDKIFSQLSRDFSFFNESIDNDEINDYIADIKELNNLNEDINNEIAPIIPNNYIIPIGQSWNPETSTRSTLFYYGQTYIISVSDVYLPLLSSHYCHFLFNGKKESENGFRWSTDANQKSAFIQIKFGKPVIANILSMTARDVNDIYGCFKQSPTRIEIFGFDSDKRLDKLNKYDNIKWSANENKRFTIGNTKKYHGYKIMLYSSTYFNGAIGLAELNLMK